MVRKAPKIRRWVPILMSLASLATWPIHGADWKRHTGACDASAAAALTETLFATASDEDNVLRVYRRGQDGPPVAQFDLSRFLEVGRKLETDLEGAARIGDLVFWIGSHSRNEQGEPRPARHVLFATAIRGGDTAVRLEPHGRPFTGLVRAMAATPALASLALDRAADRPGEAPGGLNIEALAAGEDGALLIGFRNPVPGGRALVVPLLNPVDVLAGGPPRFGAPQTPDLGGLGIRDMARVAGGYCIVAGPAVGGGRHRLYSWSGATGVPKELRKAIPKEFQAEAIVVTETGNTTAIDLLSDDGGARVAGRRCEEIKDANLRAFRELRIGRPE